MTGMRGEFAEERRFWVERGFTDPMVAFNQHKSNANKRGIPFELTFAQWWDMWAIHFHQRGPGRGNKMMCRLRDQGGYVVGNVRIATAKENQQERAVGQKVRAAGTSGRRQASLSPLYHSVDVFRSPFKKYEDDCQEDY